MPKFEKQYVHFMWNDALEGKEGFFADNIDELINIVATADMLNFGKLSKRIDCNGSYPFTYEDTNVRFRFFYFDPDLHVNSVVTCRELAQWLAEGYGQYICIPGDIAMYHYTCSNAMENTPVHVDIRVRLWGDTEWHIPTRAYMGIKEHR